MKDIEDLRARFKIKENILDHLMVQDIYNSLAIEGNTLTREEITVFLDYGITVNGKPFKDFLEARNYNDTLEWLKVYVKKGNIKLDSLLIKLIHSKIMNGYYFAGKYRKEFVALSTTTYIPPNYKEVSEMIEGIVDEYNAKSFILRDYEKIFKFKREFERIHPFKDGNGRTGRVLMNLLLLQKGYPYITIYPEDRVRYFESLENDTFTEFASNQLRKTYEFIEKYNN